MKLRLVEALRADRPLAAAFALLLACAWLPLFAAPFLPFVDLPQHSASAALLLDSLTGRGVARELFVVEWAPVPYWTQQLLLGLAQLLGGPLFAAKAISALAILALPLSCLRLCLALDRSPRVALGSFLLVWDYSLYWGWSAFLLGMALSFYALALLLEAKTTRESARVVPITLLIALTHPQAVAFLLVTAAALLLVRRPRWHALRLHALGCSGSALAFVPWLTSRLGPERGVPGPGAWPPRFEWVPLGQKVTRLFENSIENGPGWLVSTASAVAFLLALLGPLLLARLPALPASERSCGRSWVIAGCCFGAYLGLPMTIEAGQLSHWGTYPRFATWALLSLLFVPRPDLAGRRALALAPGVVTALALDAAVFAQFREFGRLTRPLETIAGALPEGARLLPLVYHGFDPSLRQPSLHHLHGYLVALRSVYDPHLFDNPNRPVGYRPERRLPAPPWNDATKFQLGFAQFYDYVLIQGLERDPLARDPLAASLVRPVAEAGMWRLYRVSPDARAVGSR